MARARTMPRHTVAPAAAPEDQAAPEADTSATEPAGQDLHEPPAPQPPAGRPEPRTAGAHSARGRQNAHKDQSGSKKQTGDEHHSKLEERSMLDALWSAMSAVPTSVLSPPPAPVEEPMTGEAPAPAPQRPAPAIGIAPAPQPPIGLSEPPPVLTEPPPVLTEPGASGEPPAAPAAAPIAPAGLTGPAGLAGLGAAPEAPEAPAAQPDAGNAEPGQQTAPPSILGLEPSGIGRAGANTNRTIWAGPRHAAPHDWNSTSALLTVETPASITDAGLLVLRLVVGVTMAAHGAQKAFGAFGGPGLHDTAQMFATLGYQPGMLFALAAVVGELFGGLLLTAGLLTPLAAGGIIGVTVNAMVAVNFSNGFFATGNGVELPLVLSGGALALLLAGPGRYAADARIPFFNGLAVQCTAASVAMFALLTSLAAHLL
jgi:putative oxidoreductase